MCPTCLPSSNRWMGTSSCCANYAGSAGRKKPSACSCSCVTQDCVRRLPSATGTGLILSRWRHLRTLGTIVSACGAKTLPMVLGQKCDDRRRRFAEFLEPEYAGFAQISSNKLVGINRSLGAALSGGLGPLLSPISRKLGTPAMAFGHYRLFWHRERSLHLMEGYTRSRVACCALADAAGR